MFFLMVKKIESYVARLKKNSAMRENNENKITRHDDEFQIVLIVTSRYTLLFFFLNK